MIKCISIPNDFICFLLYVIKCTFYTASIWYWPSPPHTSTTTADFMYVYNILYYIDYRSCEFWLTDCRTNIRYNIYSQCDEYYVYYVNSDLYNILLAGSAYRQWNNRRESEKLLYRCYDDSTAEDFETQESDQYSLQRWTATDFGVSKSAVVVDGGSGDSS